ncbi:Crossover junction endonuclease mus81 [Umbelopsis sp. WA50703]
MATYPTALDHPMEAVKLHGIGDKLAMKLEKRMLQYCDENNLPRPERVKSKTKRTHSQMTDQTGGSQEAQGSQNKVKAKRKPTTYVPRYRSGAYGIMLALYENAESYGSQSRLSKEEIIALGQQHCDTSYDMLEAGRTYTAWSSMKTLLEKGYIWKQGSPARYSLTDTGKAMAAQLQKVARGNNQQISTNDAPSTTSEKESTEYDKSTVEERIGTASNYTSQLVSPVLYPMTMTDTALSQPMSEKWNTQETYIISSDDDDADLTKSPNHQPSASIKSLTSNSALISANHVNISSQMAEPGWYSFINMSDQSVSKCYEADVLLEESTFDISYKIKYLEDKVPKDFTEKIKFVDRTEDGFCIGYITEEVAEIYSPGLQSDQVSKKTRPSRVDKPLHNFASQVTEPDEDQQALSSDDLWTLQQGIDDNFFQSEVQPELIGSELDQCDIPPSQISELSTDLQNESQLLSQIETIPTLSQTLVSESTRDFESVLCKSYPPGSFEVVLVLDTREVKSRRDRDYIQDKLQQRGINVLVCALELGDVVWIAQKVNDQGPPDDLFLDFVLERKRMDDLVASIKDGRFLEQKYRLKKAAAKQVFYLIEEFNKEEAVRFGQTAIQTALAKTQVVDGFFVKHTASIDESIDYLERLTKLVKATYEVRIFMASHLQLQFVDFLGIFRQERSTKYPVPQ